MNTTSAVRLPVFDLDLGHRAANGLSPAPTLRVAGPQGHEPGLPLAALRRPELVSDLRRARAERFADRYEWLALRRRRAQIAARHAVEGTRVMP